MTFPTDDDRFPVRKHARLKAYDYATPNYYFVTICTYGKVCIFGMPGRLTAYGKIAQDGLEMIEKHFSDVYVDKFVVMPNHVHAVIATQGSSSLTTVVGQYKSYVTHEIHKWDRGRKIWQTSFHDHVIRNQHSYEKIWNYIEANPAIWAEDCFYQEK